MAVSASGAALYKQGQHYEDERLLTTLKLPGELHVKLDAARLTGCAENDWSGC